jgi:hypothetical protein
VQPSFRPRLDLMLPCGMQAWSNREGVRRVRAPVYGRSTYCTLCSSGAPSEGSACSPNLLWIQVRQWTQGQCSCCHGVLVLSQRLFLSLAPFLDNVSLGSWFQVRGTGFSPSSSGFTLGHFQALGWRVRADRTQPSWAL